VSAKLRSLLFTLLCCGLLTAQMTVTGTISGNVIDPSGQPIANAKVTLTSTRSGEARTTVTSDIGAFTFNAVQPEIYSLRVEQHGFFKVYSRGTLVVSANPDFSQTGR